MTIKTIQNTKQADEKQLVRSTNHHDKIFKRFFSILAFAKELIRLMFSKKDLSCFDLSKLRVEKDTWANKLADLVYSLPFKEHPDKSLTVFILLEHKVKYDPRIWSQLLSYQASLHDHISKAGWPMPIIVGVFYHGKKPWEWPQSFQEGLWGKNILKKLGFLTQFMLNYKIKLLSTHDELLQQAMGDKSLKSQAILNLMDKIWELEDSPEELKKAVALFGELSGEKEDFILYVLDYLESMKVVTNKSWRDLEKELVLEGTFKKGGFMDIREEIKERGRLEGWQKGQQEGWQKGQQEGWQKGQQEGMQQGQRKLILKLLEGGLNLQSICKYTGFSEDEINRLKNGSN